jgi:phosphohistidine phosphatase SixA
MKQAAQRGSDLRSSGIKITAVVASPFTRCIQTAVEVLHFLHFFKTEALTGMRRLLTCQWWLSNFIQSCIACSAVGAEKESRC